MSKETRIKEYTTATNQETKEWEQPVDIYMYHVWGSIVGLVCTNMFDEALNVQWQWWCAILDVLTILVTP